MVRLTATSRICGGEPGGSRSTLGGVGASVASFVAAGEGDDGGEGAIVAAGRCNGRAEGGGTEAADAVASGRCCCFAGAGDGCDAGSWVAWLQPVTPSENAAMKITREAFTMPGLVLPS